MAQSTVRPPLNPHLPPPPASLLPFHPATQLSAFLPELWIGLAPVQPWLVLASFSPSSSTVSPAASVPCSNPAEVAAKGERRRARGYDSSSTLMSSELETTNLLIQMRMIPPAGGLLVPRYCGTGDPWEPLTPEDAGPLGRMWALWWGPGPCDASWDRAGPAW